MQRMLGNAVTVIAVVDFHGYMHVLPTQMEIKALKWTSGSQLPQPSIMKLVASFLYVTRDNADGREYAPILNAISRGYPPQFFCSMI